MTVIDPVGNWFNNPTSNRVKILLFWWLIEWCPLLSVQFKWKWFTLFIPFRCSRSRKKLIPSKICPLDMGRIASPLFSAVTFKTNEMRSNDDLHAALGTNGLISPYS